MKSKYLTLLSFFVVFTMVLMGCAPAATAAPTAVPAQPTAVPVQPTAAAAQPTAAAAQPTAVPQPTATTAPQPTATSAGPSVVNFVTDSDTNISDWMANVIAPAFHAAYPQYTLKVTIVRGIGNGDQDIADRADAALKANADPQVDVLEYDALSEQQLITDGLWETMDTTTVPNAKNVLKGIQTSPYSMPYRGSQVLLAYDSTKIQASDVPQTFADLITWIKAHPGQFVYCRPDKGGSGDNFVVRAIYEVTGKDPTLFKPGAADPALLAKYADAWTLLRSINSAIYDNGAYPAGNTQSLTLLANGSVSMATAWSDQALQALANGVLAPTIKLTQLTDVPFPGGDTMLSVPKNSRNLAGANALVNFMLSSDGQTSVVKDIGGFPAVDWSTLPQDLQTQYTSVIAKSVPDWPGGDYDTALVKGWYDNVATNIKQGS